MSYFILLLHELRNCYCRAMGEAVSGRSATAKLAFRPMRFSVQFVVAEQTLGKISCNCFGILPLVSFQQFSTHINLSQTLTRCNLTTNFPHNLMFMGPCIIFIVE